MISTEKRKLGTWKDGGKKVIEIETVHVVPPGDFHGERIQDWQEVNDLIRGIREAGKRVTFVSGATSSGVINAHEECDVGRGVEAIDFGFDPKEERVFDQMRVQYAKDGITPEYVWSTGPAPIRSLNSALKRRFQGLTSRTGLIYQVDFDLTTGAGSAIAANQTCRAKGDKRTILPVVEMIWSRGGVTAEKITDPRVIRAILSTNGAGGAILAQKLRVSPMLPYESVLVLPIDEPDPQRFHGVASGFIQSRLLPWIIAGNEGVDGVSIDYAEIIHSSGLRLAIDVSTMLDPSGMGKSVKDARWFEDTFLRGAAGSLVFGVRHKRDFDMTEDGGVFDNFMMALEEGEGRGIDFSDPQVLDAREDNDIKAIERIFDARQAVPYEARRRNEALEGAGQEGLDTVSFDSDYGTLVDVDRVWDSEYQDACASRHEGLTRPYSEGRERMANELGAESIDTGHGLAFFPAKGYDPSVRGLSGRHDRLYVKKGLKQALVGEIQEVETSVGREALAPHVTGILAEQDRMGEKSYHHDTAAWEQYALRRTEAARDTFALISAAGQVCSWRVPPALRAIGEHLLGEGVFSEKKSKGLLVNGLEQAAK